MRFRPFVAAALLLAGPLSAQQTAQYPTSWDPKLLERPDVKAAMAMLEKNFPQQVEEWVRITEMPGKSGLEQAAGPS